MFAVILKIELVSQYLNIELLVGHESV